MEIFLSYQGTISTTGHTRQKFTYRRAFLAQLKLLDAYLREQEAPESETFSPGKIRPVGAFNFLPLVTKSCKKVIDLEITLLSHAEPSCNHNYPTGDLDNLLKALLDGLRMAQNKNEIRSELPGEGETPFLCLLEDDQMVRHINIRHDRLLFTEKKVGQNEIFTLIKVSILPKFPYF